MSGELKTISREDLYQKVWITPFVRLAKEFGYTYLQLVEICERFSVPRPTGGYWERLRRGGASEQVPLPPASPGSPVEIPLGSLKGELVPELEGVQMDRGLEERPATTPEVDSTAASQAEVGRASNGRLVGAEGAGPVRVTRAELYELVWKKTLTRLAEEFGTQLIEWNRACEALDVPRPDPGYWPRLKLGLPVEKRPPLPEQQPGAPAEYLLREKGHRKAKPPESSKTEENSRESAVSETQEKVEQAKIDGEAAVERKEPVGANSSASAASGRAVNPQVEEAPPVSVRYTREELYKALWNTPCQKLAATLGISDVALAKTCRRMGIPRPPRGYWARLEAGEKLRKEPLPPAKQGHEPTVTFYVKENMERRKEWAANNLLTAGRSGQQERVELAPEGSQPDTVTEKHGRALEKAKPDGMGFVTVRGKSLFACEVSQGLKSRLLRAMQTLVGELEDRDYVLRDGENDYQGLQVCRDEDRVSLRFFEAREEFEREPTLLEKRKPPWAWPSLKQQRGTGLLSIEVMVPGLRGRRTWTEGADRSLEDVLALVLGKVEGTFRGLEEQRVRMAEQEKRRQEEAKREEERRKEQARLDAERRAREAETRAREEEARRERARIAAHEKKLLDIANLRRANLLRAVKGSRVAEDIRAYAANCESAWRQKQGGELTSAQSEWLTWARAQAEDIDPSSAGYPDPVADGKLDLGSVPVDGPYPVVRTLRAGEAEV